MNRSINIYFLLYFIFYNKEKILESLKFSTFGFNGLTHFKMSWTWFHSEGQLLTEMKGPPPPNLVIVSLVMKVIFWGKKWKGRRQESNLSYFLIKTALFFDTFPKLFLIENHKSAKFSDILICVIENQQRHTHVCIKNIMLIWARYRNLLNSYDYIFTTHEDYDL